jgi:hypothetical protein
MTREMAEGMDRFWRMRSWLDIQALPEARRAKVLPFIVEWARGGATLTGEQVFRGYSQMGAIREAAVAACAPYDVVLSPTAPIAAFPAELASPTGDPARSLEHIAFTLPFNMSEQPAASINCGYTEAGLPIGLQIAGHRHDDLGVLRRGTPVGAPAPAATALAGAAGHTLKLDVMASQDPRGNPVGTASAVALGHAETALWRLVSFFDTPLADLDAAGEADPAWAWPHLMRAGFLLTLTEPGLGADVDASLQRAEAAMAPGGPGARTGAPRRVATLRGRRLARCVRIWDALLDEHPRDLAALQWAHLFDFYRGDASMLRQRPARVLTHWAAGDPLRPYLLGMHAFGLEECHAYAQAEAVGREAVAGKAKVPWATHAVAHVMEMQGRVDDGIAWLQGALRRLVRRQRLRRPPLVAPRAVPPRAAGHRGSAGDLRRAPVQHPQRPHLAAAGRRRAAVATAACWASTSARAGTTSPPAGTSRPTASAIRRSMTCMPCWCCSAAAGAPRRRSGRSPHRPTPRRRPPATARWRVASACR